MNTERVLVLADFIEKLKPGYPSHQRIVKNNASKQLINISIFDLNAWVVVVENNYTGECGTCGCIAGSAAACFYKLLEFQGPNIIRSVEDSARRVLGLSPQEAADLFVPEFEDMKGFPGSVYDFGSNLYDYVTPGMAASVLRDVAKGRNIYDAWQALVPGLVKRHYELLEDLHGT